MRVMTFSGVGDNPVAFGFSPRAVATFDARSLDPRVPLRLHTNAGLVVDGTGSLVDPQRLNASEEYALGINRYPRLTLGLGVEAPLPMATPFLEYGLMSPLGVEGGQLVAPDGTLVPVGVVERVVSEPVVTQAASTPQTAQVVGVALDARTRQPLPGVLVSMVDSALPPVASDPRDGRFLTYALPIGPVKLSVRKEGDLPLEKEVVLKAGETTHVELALVAEVKQAMLALAVTSKRKPVSASLAFLGGPEPRRVAFSADDAATHKLQLPSGRYKVEVTAPGFLAQMRDVQVAEGSALELAFDLEPEPKQWLVKRENDRLELLQPVRFAEGKAVLLPDSYPLLAQVMDLIVRTGIQRLRIEVHTDNQGDKAANLALSKDRARAVADYLVKAGLDPARLESEGFGDSRPVAPNLTPKGRELNRRVDFVLLER